MAGEKRIENTTRNNSPICVPRFKLNSDACSRTASAAQGNPKQITRRVTVVSTTDGLGRNLITCDLRATGPCLGRGSGHLLQIARHIPGVIFHRSRRATNTDRIDLMMYMLRTPVRLGFRQFQVTVAVPKGPFDPWYFREGQGLGHVWTTSSDGWLKDHVHERVLKSTLRECSIRQ